MARTAKPDAKPATNIFGGAPTIAAPVTASKSKLAEKALKGLQDVVAFDAVIAALEAIKVDRARRVKELMAEDFLNEGLLLGRRPENFRGIDGVGTDCRVSAACTLKASGVAMTPDAIALFKSYGFDDIHFEVTPIIADALILNPAYTSDGDFLKKLETKFGAAFAELQDERGALILHQEGSSKTKMSDAGLIEIFAKPIAAYDAKPIEILGDDDTEGSVILPYTRDAADTLMSVAYTLAITPKLETNGDLKPALEIVKTALGSPLYEEVVKEAATSASALNGKTKKRAAEKAEKSETVKKAA